MAAATPRLAKLTRPRLHSVTARDRLFQALDAARLRPVVWLAALPGAGKTTLVASWLDQHHAPDLWYQADAGDCDPATFFMYLGRCAQDSGRAGSLLRTPLPLLTPDHLGDIAAFGRRFVRALYAQLPADCALVLDNFQEIAEDSVLHEALLAMMEEIPVGCTLIVISRNAPSSRYARLIANRTVEVIPWESLRLTLDETRAIVAASGVQQSPALAERLHVVSDGWAAGLTLMLERVRRNPLTPDHFEAETREAVFNYFAGEVFDRTTPDNQQILLACAHLPRVSAGQAERLCGSSSAPRLLEQLYRRHLFTDRRLGAEPVYQFHALFREFLLGRAAEWYTPAGRAQICRRGARLLEECGDLEAAVVLDLQSQDMTEAGRLICALAPMLLSQGRAQTLVDWILAVPEPVRKVQPWLEYWMGTALIHNRHAEARQCLETAFDAFGRAGNDTARIQALCGIMESHYLECVSYSLLEPLGKQLQTLVQQVPCFASAEQELRALTNLFTAYHFSHVRGGSIDVQARRMQELLSADIDPNARVVAAHALFRHAAWSVQGSLADNAIEATRPLLAHPSVSWINRLTWWVRLAHCQLFLFRLAAAHESAVRAQEIAELGPAHTVKATLGTFFVAFAVIDADLTLARDALDKLEGMVRAGWVNETALASIARLFVCAACGDLQGALAAATVAVDCFTTVRNVGAETEFRITLAHLQFELGRPDQACAGLAQCRDAIAGTYLAHYKTCADLVEAYAHLKAGDLHGCDQLLSQAVGQVASTTLFPLRLLPDILPAMLGRALRLGLAPEGIRGCIQAGRIRPLPDSAVDWPWPVKIRVLGGFDIAIDDQPPPAQSLKQRKVLSVIRLLACLGGRDVAPATIMDALWPDTEGDIARKNLDVYLSRARKLLGHPQSIFVRGGHVHLDRSIVWVDADEFVVRASQLHSSAADGDDWLRGAQLALALYRGHLCEGAERAPGLGEQADRLRRHWMRLVDCAVDCQLHRGSETSAAAFLHGALAIDPGNADWAQRLSRLRGPLA